MCIKDVGDWVGFFHASTSSWNFCNVSREHGNTDTSSCARRCDGWVRDDCRDSPFAFAGNAQRKTEEGRYFLSRPGKFLSRESRCVAPPPPPPHAANNVVLRVSRRENPFATEKLNEGMAGVGKGGTEDERVRDQDEGGVHRGERTGDVVAPPRGKLSRSILGEAWRMTRGGEVLASECGDGSGRPSCNV
ncbi:hypothetical protein RUM43_006756 [Polyplax serrata]|uniref:Uncharacterized protein n=1 Tax=Polyplax serrata TaxID=468196 RepID=A0AAN8P4S9_POLSC